MRFINKIQFIVFFIISIDINAQNYPQNLNPHINNINFKNKNYGFEYNAIANLSTSKTFQNIDYKNKKLPDGFSNNYNQNINLGLDSQLLLKGGYKINSKNYYGVTAKFETNLNISSHYQKPNIDQFFLYNKNEFGTFEFGYNSPVNQRMKHGPSRFARGAGGINGKYLEFINFPTLKSNNQICSNILDSSICNNIRYPKFITLAQSPMGHGGYAKGFYSRDIDNLNNYKNIKYFNKNNYRSIKDDSYEGVEDALKINYFSPIINNFQLGFSFAPNSQNRGFMAKTAPDSHDSLIKDIFSFAVNYNNDFDNLNLAISSTLEYGKSKKINNIKRNNLFAYDLGWSLSYFGFTIGNSFGSWQKSLYAKNGIYACPLNENEPLLMQNCSQSNNKLNSSYYITYGIAYQIGPIKTSITALQSSFQNNKYNAVSFGIDYKIKKNLISYLEITNYKFQTEVNNFFDNYQQIRVANSNYIPNNRGNVLLTGIYYYF